MSCWGYRGCRSGSSSLISSSEMFCREHRGQQRKIWPLTFRATVVTKIWGQNTNLQAIYFPIKITYSTSESFTQHTCLMNLILTSYSSSRTTSCFSISIFTKDRKHVIDWEWHVCSDDVLRCVAHSEWLHCSSPCESETSSASPADLRPPHTRLMNSTEEKTRHNLQ